MPVMVEVCWLTEKYRGARAEAAFIDSIVTGQLTLLDVVDSDLPRIAELVRTYADLPLGVVDAAVVAVAERLGLREVATLDHRHFSVVRPRHVPAFDLLP